MLRLSNCFEISTVGGTWTDVPKTCQQGVYSGDPYHCDHNYGLYDSDSVDGGNGWYGKSRVIWWNQQSRNPSTADGSWTMTADHGPMDCKTGRSQVCQWR